MKIIIRFIEKITQKIRPSPKFPNPKPAKHLRSSKNIEDKTVSERVPLQQYVELYFKIVCLFYGILIIHHSNRIEKELFKIISSTFYYYICTLIYIS